MPINQVVLGDCLEVMRGWPDKCVDLIVTDPPYGVDFPYESYDDTEDNWFRLMFEFVPLAKRIAHCVILPSCQIMRMEWWYNHFPPDWIISWYKGSPGTASFVGFNSWEPLLVFGRCKGTQYHDYFKAIPDSFSNGHPCPKPIEYGRILVDRASKIGDIILDPFAGSGTTLVAAKQLGRKYIGIEIEPKYVAICKERLKQEQLPL